VTEIRWPACAAMVVAATLSTSAIAEQISASKAIKKIESRDEATVSFVFGIYTGIYRANESLSSSHKPSLYCPLTNFCCRRTKCNRYFLVDVVMLDALVSVFPCPIKTP
jgi:hypothetical protein